MPLSPPASPTTMNPLQQAEKLVKSVGIPPQPKVLLELNRMARSSDADLQAMGQLVAKDVGISARVVRLASSPLLGSGQQVTSIQEALMALGMNMFIKGVLTAALEAAFAGNSQNNKEFWRHSLAIARLSQVTAQRFAPEMVDEAYTLGLFHDLAVSLMLKKHGDYYWRLQDKALKWNDTITEEEDETFKTNHASVGFFVAKRWSLSPELLQAILFHHESDLSVIESEKTRQLLSILQLAEIFYTRDKEALSRLNYETYDDPDHLDMIAESLQFDVEEDLYDFSDIIEETLAEI